MRRNIYRNYSKLSAARGNLSEALLYERKSVQLTDSIFSETGSSRLAEMETFYKLEQKEQQLKEIDQIRNQREQELVIQKELAQRQQIIIGVSAFAIVLLVLAGIVGYQYYKAKSEVNKQLKRLNKDILEQKEEIQVQSEELLTASNTISTINKQLEAKIEERTYELKQAYKELDTFFYRSSHDFRRPITTFLGLAGVASITVKDPVSLELFEKVKETARGLDKMLQKLQSISDLGAQQMIYKEVFLKELMDEILDGFREPLQQKRITVHTDVKENSSFLSYPVLIKLIFENLIENAIHFAAFENPYVKIKVRLDDRQMELEVEDNGQGIPEEYQSRIFEMYFRANERSKGNGLGLYITKKAVERLGGWIGFSSQHNKGSVFVVRIPNGSA
jgi:signal transduction histidine kinase